MKEFLIYTALRLSLFVGALAVVAGLWVAVSDSVNILWALVIAFLLSGVGSFFLLDAQREAFARRVDARARRASSKFEEMRSREDAD